jgi:hypothetical protein
MSLPRCFQMAKRKLPKEITESVARAMRTEVPAGKAEIIVFIDKRLPGFGLRVRASGKRTWIFLYRVGSRQRRFSIGSVDRIAPEEAYDEALAM